ncbi:MAG: hypothetical protein V3T69_11235, partial [Acidiferrobacterales bacterium]
MNERIAQLEKEILERQDAEAEQEERIAELLSSKSALEKQGEDIVRLADTCPGMTASGVRRGKAAFFSGCKSHPATIAPAGSNRSSHGGDEMAEAFGIA